LFSPRGQLRLGGAAASGEGIVCRSDRRGPADEIPHAPGAGHVMDAAGDADPKRSGHHARNARPPPGDGQAKNE